MYKSARTDPVLHVTPGGTVCPHSTDVIDLQHFHTGEWNTPPPSADTISKTQGQYMYITVNSVIQNLTYV